MGVNWRYLLQNMNTDKQILKPMLYLYSALHSKLEIKVNLIKNRRPYVKEPPGLQCVVYIMIQP